MHARNAARGRSSIWTSRHRCLPRLKRQHSITTTTAAGAPPVVTASLRFLRAAATRWPPPAVPRRVARRLAASPRCHSRDMRAAAAAAGADDPRGSERRLARLGAACAACFSVGRAEPEAARVEELVSALGAATNVAVRHCVLIPTQSLTRCSPRCAECITSADVGLAADAASVPPAPGAVRRWLSTAAWLLGLGTRAAAAPSSPSARGDLPCTYLALHEGAGCTVGIFCLPVRVRSVYVRVRVSCEQALCAAVAIAKFSAAAACPALVNEQPN
jgi:hypothetical protein